MEANICRISENTKIARDIFSLTIESGKIAKSAKAGQFLHIKCPGVFLRRPISICDAGEEKVRILYEVKGEGTSALSKVQKGEMLDVLGPLGRGFELTDQEGAALIGGGLGTFPLLYLAKQLKDPLAYLGFCSKDRLVLEEEFKLAADTRIYSDDGSCGITGFPTKGLLDLATGKKPPMIYACGPKPMLKAVSKIAKDLVIPCQVSLEERMGCGIGACLVCNCKIKSENEIKHKRVCLDGPVFNSEEVCWDD